MNDKIKGENLNSVRNEMNIYIEICIIDQNHI